VGRRAQGGAFELSGRGLPAEAVAEALRLGYGVEAHVERLDLGNDADSWSYRASAANGALFLKLRTAHLAAAGSQVPRHLGDRGVPGVLAPVRTLSGAPSYAVDGFALIVQPWLDARPAMEVGLSDAQWEELGQIVAILHGSCDAPPPGARLEAFTPTRRELAEPLDEIAPRTELRELWRLHRPTICALVERADVLGRELPKRSLPPVLCHGDLHTNNVLVDSDDRLCLVDWDEATWGPRERDLMFFVGGIHRRLVSPRQTEAFLRGYGAVAVDETALEYYRVAWAVQDIAAVGEQAALLPQLDDARRKRALAHFALLFEPGAIVEIALATRRASP
jgi:spectinomycin phosphotransferase